jgi:hypothetical protein
MTRFLFSVLQLRVSRCGALSLTRRRICNLPVQLFLCLARTVTLGSKSRRTHTIIYCLIWDPSNLEGQVPVFISPRNRVPVIPPGIGFPFVASYDSQGYRGGIQTRLHTGGTNLESQVPLFISRRNRVAQIYPPPLRGLFCLLLRLVRLRWRYFIPLPHGIVEVLNNVPTYNISAQTSRTTPFRFCCCCFCCLVTTAVRCLVSWSLSSNRSTCYIIFLWLLSTNRKLSNLTNCHYGNCYYSYSQCARWTHDREISYYDWFFREYHQSFQQNSRTVSMLSAYRFFPRTRT